MTARHRAKRPLLSCALLACLAVSSVGFAQTAAIAPADSKAPLRATLSNGLRVVVVRNPLAPVVSISVNYLVGSDEAPAGFPGWPTRRNT